MASAGSPFKPLIDALIEAHFQEETARYLAFSGIALLLYDWLISLDLEIEYTWGKKWTFARVIYHLNRILPILLLGGALVPGILFAPESFTPSVCKKVMISYSCGVVILFILNCSTAIVRCWALYGERWVLWVLIPGLFLTVGQATLQVMINLEKSVFFSNPVPEVLQGCLVSLPNTVWLGYLSGVIYETIVFGMILWRIYYLKNDLSLTPLMRELLKDGTIFFVVNLALMLFSCIGSAYSSTMYIANNSGLLTALTSAMCSRIFFSMRMFATREKVVVNQTYGPNSYRSGVVRTEQFIVGGEIPLETFSEGDVQHDTKANLGEPPEDSSVAGFSRGRTAREDSGTAIV